METNIYAITDSHQESRNLSRLLSGIYNYQKDSNKRFLILDAGDLFKGIFFNLCIVDIFTIFKIKRIITASRDCNNFRQQRLWIQKI